MLLGEVAGRGPLLKALNLLTRNVNTAIDVDGFDDAPFPPTPASSGRDAHVGQPTIVTYEIRCSVVFGHALKIIGAQAQIERFEAEFRKNDTTGAFCIFPLKSQQTPGKFTRPAARCRCSSSKCPYTFPTRIPPSL